MANIILVTDSTADIPKEMAEQLDIHIVPLKVHINGQTFLDGVTITPTEFFDKLVQAEQFPTTSQPSPIDFEQKYLEIIRQFGQDVQIISLHLSSALSGTFQSANLARNMVGSEFDITVIDSKRAAFLLGMMVVQAAKAAKKGQSKDDCIQIIEKMKQSQRDYFVLDTLTYLQKGGRIGKAQALIGTLLNVEPILTLNDSGEVTPFEKVRGKKKAVARMMEELKQYAGGQRVVSSVLYAGNLAEAEELKKHLQEQFNIEEITLSEVGPVIGAHVGPNVLAVSMCIL